MMITYEYENGIVYTIETIETDEQTVTVKTIASNVRYDETTGGFEEYTPQISPVIDRQQIAMDAIMAGMADMEARQTQAIDALMTGMMELYAQNEEVKAEIAANSK
jgi:predicted transcriptional regulator